MGFSMWLAWLGMAGFVGVYGWVWKKEGKKGRALLEWGLVALVAGMSLASVLTHEPWRDELHAWLLARELPISRLWGEMACEGHFLPWFLLLRPLAHSGAPVWTMGLVSWVLNATAVAWLARRSPLTGWEKAVAGGSCVFLYLNPVVARPYVLAPLGLFGLAALWEKRDERPVAFGLWVALLANTHLYLEGIAAAVFGVFAWENVLRRRDGKSWRKCGRQWTGLGVMAAGGALALAQALPSLWKSSLVEAKEVALWQDTSWFFQACVSRWGALAMVAGLGLLGVLAWKKDRGAFWVLAAGLAYMWGFAVFLYGTTVPNRALLWWPLALSVAWVVAGKGGGGARWRVLAVVAAGLSIVRPDMTWRDWRREYDPLPGACRWIAERYGAGAEVWINGGDCATEPAAVYLGNVMDWRTGEKARPNSWQKNGPGKPPFRACAEAVFRTHPEKESFMALGGMWPFQYSGLTEEDCLRPGVEVERTWTNALGLQAVGLVLMRVDRWGREWGPFGIARYQCGDKEGAVAAWKRAVEEDESAWEAMNNLAWVALEDGRVEEARGWIDRAMEHEAARGNASVRDTEAAVGRAEMDLLKN